jgi:predicted ABC-type ATPase
LKEKTVYIIAGCNGAGKTTASYSILPAILDCKEFVNADEIAKGLSPFRPEKAAFEAGRIMLERINFLLTQDDNFAFETTLSTRSYRNKLLTAKSRGYAVKLLFFWLPSQEMAVKRVSMRVREGGHHIPTDVVRRRYLRGIQNLFKIYISLCDEWAVFDNSDKPMLIADGTPTETDVVDFNKWTTFKNNLLT